MHARTHTMLAPRHPPPEPRSSEHREESLDYFTFDPEFEENEAKQGWHAYKCTSLGTLDASAYRVRRDVGVGGKSESPPPPPPTRLTPSSSHTVRSRSVVLRNVPLVMWFRTFACESRRYDAVRKELLGEDSDDDEEGEEGEDSDEEGNRACGFKCSPRGLDVAGWLDSALVPRSETRWSNRRWHSSDTGSYRARSGQPSTHSVRRPLSQPTHPTAYRS